MTIDVEHDGITYTVEVLNKGAPARLTGHPDNRQPEEPVEWRAIYVDEFCAEPMKWPNGAPLTPEETEAIHALETEEVREQQATGERA